MSPRALSQGEGELWSQVAAPAKPICQQQGREEAQAQMAQASALFAPRLPKVVELLEQAGEEVLALYGFAPEHSRQLYSTNPLERLSKELKRRSAAVGIFPTRQSVIRLLGALLDEQNGERIVARHCFSEASMNRIGKAEPAGSDKALVAAQR